MKAHSRSHALAVTAAIISQLLLVTFGSHSALAAPPPHDDFEQAAILTGLPASGTGTTVDATLQTGEPDDDGFSGSSIWWQWTAPRSEWVEANSFGSDFDTVLSVYTGSTLATVALIGMNDDARDTTSSLTKQSRVKFQAAAGTVYRIQLMGYDYAEGQASLSIQSTLPPSPPVLKRLTLTPGAVDVTTNSVPLTAEIEFTAEDSLEYAALTFTGPRGDDFFDFARLFTTVSGTSKAGVYQFTVDVPAHRRSGVWQVEATLEDAEGGRSAYGGLSTPPLPAGSTTAITLTNNGQNDFLPPQLGEATLTPNPVDITTGSKTVTVRVQASDDLGLDTLYVWLETATGALIAETSLNITHLISGTPQAGIWEGSLRIPPFIAPGTLLVSYDIEDASGRFIVYGPNGNANPLGTQPSITIQNTGAIDTQGPVLTSISADATTVDVTNASQKVLINALLQDAPAGLSYAAIFLYTPEGQLFHSSTLYDRVAAPFPTTGVATKATVTIPRFIAPGTYSWRLEASDSTDRYSDYGGLNQPFPGAFSGTLVVQNTGPVDTSGPVLNSISADKTTVDVTAASQDVIITATLEDPFAGLANAYVALYNPQGEYFYYTFLFDQGSPPFPTAAVTANARVTIPKFLSPGTYQWQLVTGDGNDQYSKYGGTDLPFPSPFTGNLTVENTGVVDMTPPQLTSLTVTPSNLNSNLLPTTITVTAIASDDTAVVAAKVLLNDESTSFPLTQTSGTASNGSWTVVLNIPSGYPAGSYSLGVILDDSVGNTSRYGGTEATFPRLPPGSTQTLNISTGIPDAYSTWRAQRPALAGPDGQPEADFDGDELPNAVEFLCGTDPLLNSNPDGPDPLKSRAPSYSITPTHFQVEYQLSAENAALGSGNSLSLQPQSSSDLASTWSNLAPTLVANDRWRAETPRGAGRPNFIRFVVLP